MALSFNKQTGGAQKSSNNSYKYVDGDNKVRIVGDILARYVYWIKGENDKNLPLECLSFDRDQELNAKDLNQHFDSLNFLNFLKS